jgi:DNA-binding NtrC family response regulator
MLMLRHMQQRQPAGIVIIDDDPEYLDYLATLLRRAGYEVSAFTAAVAALRSSAIGSASVVITDVFMPEMDGFEVLKALRTARPMLPLIAVSGAGPFDSTIFLSAIQKLGARAGFAKPVDEHSLLSTIERLLRAERKRSYRTEDDPGILPPYAFCPNAMTSMESVV